MPNYSVTYNISNDDVKKLISELLQQTGLKFQADASTRFGFYKNNKETFIKLLKKAKEKYHVDTNDSIILYYAELNRNNYATLNAVKIE